MIDLELIVPPGWVQIPTTPDTTKLRRRIIDDLIHHYAPASLPRDKVGPWRTMLRKELVAATEDAARNNARSVLLPLQEFAGFRLPGSLLVAVVENEEETEAEDSERLLAELLADAGDDGRYVEIGGAPAVRVAAVTNSDRIKRKTPSWRVSYYVSNPDAPGVWGLLSFVVLTDGDVDAEPVQAVLLVFDAVVSTLKWGDRVDIRTEDEILTALDEAAAATPPGENVKGV